MLIDNVHVTIEDGQLEKSEIQYYIGKIKKHSKGKELKSIDFKLTDDYVDLRYAFHSIPFERIRRVNITIFNSNRCVV